jgi:serine/threonine protein kinase
MPKDYIHGDEPVPGFQLLQLVGHDSTGELWYAKAPGGISVSLKIISLDARPGQRLLRTLRGYRSIKHPNLVPISAFWLKDAMGELIADDGAEGPTAGGGDEASKGRLPAELIIMMSLGDHTLLDRFQECRRTGQAGIPPEELLEYMEGAAKGIDHLNRPIHDLGQGPVAIQHCNVKPQNVLLVGGAAQVYGLGVNLVVGGPRKTSIVTGTIAYAAPEIIRENRASESTDQYSLAVLYYEMRTGRLPFAGESIQKVLQAHVQGDLDLSHLVEPERFVIRRATARSPGERFRSCAEMVESLSSAYRLESGVSAG